MQRAIIGFHQDDEFQWVADLACGHTQHVRHQRHILERPWTLTPEGRQSRIGALLNCIVCDDEPTQTPSTE